MATLAPWAHPSCPSINLAFGTCQEVLNHVSVFTGPGPCPCPCAPALPQYPDFYGPSTVLTRVLQGLTGVPPLTTREGKQLTEVYVTIERGQVT